MPHRIVDTNVPLTAAGTNDVASDTCQQRCVQFIDGVLKGEIKVVIDEDNEILFEYGKNVPVLNRSEDLAGQFLIHLYNHQFNSAFVQRLTLEKNAFGQYADYPDNEDNWTTNDVRCKRFDPDDKKWVALALRFKSETGSDAPIVNAADRCWIAFAAQLKSVGAALETLCRDER